MVSEPVGYFTRVVEDLNSGLPRTNPAIGQGGARSSAPTTWPRLLLSCRKEGMTLNIRKKTVMDQTQDLTNQPHKSIKQYDDTCICDYLEWQWYFIWYHQQFHYGCFPKVRTGRPDQSFWNWIIRFLLNFFLNPSLPCIPFRNKRIWPESSD